MANLSDLAGAIAAPAIPDWISALGQSGGFVADALPVRHQAVVPPSISQDEIEEQQFITAFREGEAAGRAAAEAEAKEQRDAGEYLKLAMVSLDDAAKLSLRDTLAKLVAGLCADIIEPHLISQETLNTRCAVAAEQIGEAPSRCALHLHPDDAKLLDTEFAKNWRIIPDTSLARGAIRLEGPDGAISDDPAGWRRSIAEALIA